jgi:hypothetical protein
VTRKPRIDKAERRDGVGAAPANMTLTTRGSGRKVSLAGAFMRLFMTTGAQQKCVTPCFTMPEYIAFVLTYTSGIVLQNQDNTVTKE